MENGSFSVDDPDFAYGDPAFLLAAPPHRFTR
jgi:hypothetical protein